MCSVLTVHLLAHWSVEAPQGCPAPSPGRRPSLSLLHTHSRSFQAHLGLSLRRPDSWEPSSSWQFSAVGGLSTVLTGDGSVLRGLGRGVLPSRRPSWVPITVCSQCVWLSGALTCSLLVTRGIGHLGTNAGGSSCPLCLSCSLPVSIFNGWFVFCS